MALPSLRRRIAAGAWLGLLLAACADDGPPRVAEVALGESALELRVGNVRQLVATARGDDGGTLGDRTITWSSSSVDVATVNATGLVTARAPGVARVTATSEGASGTATVTVTPVPVMSIALGLAELDLVVGQTRGISVTAYDSVGGALSGRVVTWRSDDAGVLAVGASGEARAIGPGATRVTATVEGKSATLAATVRPRVPTRIASRLPSLVVAPGLGWTMEVDVLDQVGATMLDAPRGYDSSDPAVASVAADGTITGVSAGSASVTVRSGDASIAVPVSVLGARTTVSGRLVSTAAPTQPLRVSVRLPRSQQEWAAATASDGTYSFDAAIPSGATDTVTLAIDAASADRRTHRPILDAVPSPGLAARTQRPLLVPRQVQLPAYAFGGGVQTVSLDEAFTRVCTTQSDANCNSFFPNAWLAIGPTLWAEAQLPIPVVFDRAGSTGTISLGDSVALWAVLHGMEASLGRTLFRPARPEEVPAPLGGFSTGAILVAIDGNLQGFAGWTNWYWGADLHMRGARIRVRAASLLGNESLVTHEFLHAMGFHHTCAWPTVMGGYGCPVAPGATRQDVAAFLLAYQLRRTVLASSPTTSLLAALQGERVLENGLAPALVDDRIVAARRLRVGSSALFTDGAP